MKKILLLVIFSVVLLNGYGQEKKDAVSQQQITEAVKVKWYTLEEAEKLNKVKPKKFLIDVYTDWCGWCKKMDKETFDHPVIAAYLNEYFYPVKFNAETSDTITFNGAKYIALNKGARATHPLAVSLLGWRMSYPSIVYLTEKLEYLGPMPGYKTADQMEMILTFIAQNKFQTISMEDFQKTFVGKIKPTPEQQ
jgi:thioredoxin-related protein